MDVDWREAFIGASALLGEPVADTLAALGDGAGPGAGGSMEPAAAVRSLSRRERAEEIARALTGVARELEGLRLK